MKRIKGCLNENCPEYRKTRYKDSDEFCVKCGSKLGYICKYPDCFKPIPDDVHTAYCPTHEGEHKDRKERIRGNALKVGGGVMVVGGIVKTVVDLIRKK